jgi:mercuric ion transport protein
MTRRSRAPSDAALGLGAVVLVALCCAGPALVGAGLLGALGGVLGNPLVIAAAVVLAAGAVIAALGRRRSAQRAALRAGGDEHEGELPLR